MQDAWSARNYLSPLRGGIFDLNLADGEGLLCYNCYRQRAAREKAGDSGEG